MSKRMPGWPLVGAMAVLAAAIAVLTWFSDDSPEPPDRSLHAVAPPVVGPPAVPDSPPVEISGLPPTESAVSPEVLVPSAPPEPTVTLTGRVVDESGAPVAGARVHLFDDPPPTPRHVGFGLQAAESWSEGLDDWWHADLQREDVVPRSRIDLVPANLDPLLVTTSAADGSFSVDVAARGPDGVRTRRQLVLVLHAGFAPGHPRLLAKALASGTLEDVVLARGTSVRGRLVDTDGRPVAGAEVRLGREWFAPIANVTVSDVAGEFSFSHVAARPQELRIEHPGYAPTLRGHLEPEEDTDLGDVVLHRGGTIAGRVVDSNGRPVERAHVFVTTEPIDSYETHPSQRDFKPDEDSILLEFDVAAMPQTGHAVTDDKGTFRIDGRLHENHVLYARHPLYEPARHGDIVPGGRLEIRLEPRRDQLVRVTDGAGAPVVDVELRAWRLLERSGGRRIPVADVDRAAGLHRIEGLGFRDTYLKARAPGQADAVWTLPPEDVGQREILELSLEPGFAVAAEIVDERGALLEHWGLSIVALGEGGGPVVGFGGFFEETDPSHRFEGLPAGDYEVNAHRSWGSAAITPGPALVTVGPDAPEASTTLVVRPGATLTGTISSPDEEPFWQSLWLTRLGDASEGFGRTAYRNGSKPSKYSVTGPPGDWTVHLDGEVVGTVTLVAGETTTLDLQVPAQARIVGVVTSGGAPVADARVRATYAGTRGAAAGDVTTGPDGRFVYLVPMPGAWAVGVAGAGASKSRRPLESTTVEVAEHGVTTCDLELPVGRLLITVLHDDNQPAVHHGVWLQRDPERGLSLRWTDAQGEVLYEYLPPGRWRANVDRTGPWASVTGGWIEVPTDGRLVHAPPLVMPRGHAITGAAFVAPGVPVPDDTRVRLWDVDNDEFITSQEPQDGRYRFDGLLPGAYRVALFRDDSIRTDKLGRLGIEVELADADLELDIVGAVDDDG